jgi:hypothetical protein
MSNDDAREHAGCIKAEALEELRKNAADFLVPKHWRGTERIKIYLRTLHSASVRCQARKNALIHLNGKNIETRC